MKSKYWIIALLAISFTGCYTSFVPRDRELESYENYEDENTYSEGESEYWDDNDNSGEIVVIVSDPFFSPYYDPFYNPYYNPFWGPYYYPYYGPVIGGSYFVYNDFYCDSYYYNDYYPSTTRYRNDRSHWTNLRNNGGRISVSRDRISDFNNPIDVTRNKVDTRTNVDRVRDVDLNNLGVSRTGSATSTRTADIKTSTIRKDGEVKVSTRKTTDLDRRRVSDKIIKGKSNNERIETQSSKQKVVREADVNYKPRESTPTQNRSKRVYSSSESTGSSATSSSFYRNLSSSKSSSSSRNDDSEVKSSRPATSSSRNTTSERSTSSSRVSRPSPSSNSAVSSPSRTQSSSPSSSSRSSSSSSSSSSRSSSSNSNRGRR